MLLQVLSDPRQKRFFKSKDMRDLFTLGDEYANATETSEIFASVNGEVTATLAAGQAPLPELNHAEGLLRTHLGFNVELNWCQCRARLVSMQSSMGSTTASVYMCVNVFGCIAHSP